MSVDVVAKWTLLNLLKRDNWRISAYVKIDIENVRRFVRFGTVSVV